MSKWRAKRAPTVPKEGTTIYRLSDIPYSTLVCFSGWVTLPLKVVFFGMSLIFMVVFLARTTVAGDSNFFAFSNLSNILMSEIPETFLPLLFIIYVSKKSLALSTRSAFKGGPSRFLAYVLSGSTLPNLSASKNLASAYYLAILSMTFSTDSSLP